MLAYLSNYLRGERGLAGTAWGVQSTDYTPICSNYTNRLQAHRATPTLADDAS